MDTGVGRAPSWLITRALSLLLAAAGMYPVLRAVLSGQVHGTTLLTQLVVSAVVLDTYLTAANRGAAGSG